MQEEESITNSVSGLELICQGAEAKIYKGIYLGKNVIIKERFKKAYRHPELDKQLTKERIKSEAKAIVRAKVAGVATPALYLVDFNRRCIFMEFIDNSIDLKSFIDQHLIPNKEDKELINVVTNSLGQAIAKLHSKHVVHGDLTTSNILLKNSSDLLNIKDKNNATADLIVIDFGLAQIEITAEDAAVDLYVLKRSLSTSHSGIPELFKLVYNSYQQYFKNKTQLKEIMSKYDDVQARGRKRTMVG